MKVLLVSDIESNYLWDFFDEEKFKCIDLIISCGDLKSEYLSFLVTMIKAPLFYIHGNHDKEYIKNPPSGCDSIDGKLVKYRGIRILGLGGSMKYNDTVFQYSERDMEKRIKKLKVNLFLNNGFDILVTHAAANGLGDEKDLCHEGFQSFNRLLNKYKPKYFIHGHTHLNYGIKPRIINYGETTIINSYGYFILDY